MADPLYRVEFTLAGLSCRTVAKSDRGLVLEWKARMEDQNDTEDVTLVKLPADPS